MDQPDLDYELGQAIGRAVKTQSVRNPARLNSLISDLIVDDLSLRSPLREVVDHQAFLKAEPLIPSASSQAVVGVLLDQLSSVYRDGTLERTRALLLGYFVLPQSQEQNRQEHTKAGEQSASWDNRTDRLDTLIQELRSLLKNNQWQEADRKTWQIFIESCYENENDTFDTIWPALPCGLLYEINRYWSDASNFRFGFSIQRGLWDTIIKLHKTIAAEGSPQTATEKPFQIFAEYLKWYETEESINANTGSGFAPYCLPAGFYPRCQPEIKTATSPESGLGPNSLTSNFTKVNDRLVDCGITAAALDKGSIENLKVKFFPDRETKKHSNNTTGTTGNNETPKQNGSNGHEQPTKSESSPEKKGGMSDKEWFDVLTGAGFFLLLLLSLGLGPIATPRARESCSSWATISRGFCYLKEIPIDLLR
jgi:hypothetical protein